MAVLLFPQNTYDELKTKGKLPIGSQRVGDSSQTPTHVPVMGKTISLPNTGAIAPPALPQPTSQPFQERLADKPISPISQPMPMGGTLPPATVPRAPSAMPQPSAQPFSKSGQPGIPYVDQDKMAWESLPFADRLAFKKIFMNNRPQGMAGSLQRGRGAKVNVAGMNIGKAVR